MSKVNKPYALISIFFIFNILAFGQDITLKTYPLKGPYLGQQKPYLTAEIFAPGIISTDFNESNAVFSSDGNELYYTITTSNKRTIMVIVQQNGYWREIKTASFSGTFSDLNPFLPITNNQIIFSSNRTKDGIHSKKDYDFWQVNRSPSGNWLKPCHIDQPCTANKNDFFFSITPSGIICFCVCDTDRDTNIYMKRMTDPKAHKMPSPVNTEHNEQDPLMASDERFLIFSSDRPGGFGGYDLYISYKLNDETWSEPLNMGAKINSAANDYCAALSPDNQYIFFSSMRSGNGDIYWINSVIIEQLQADHTD